MPARIPILVAALTVVAAAGYGIHHHATMRRALNAERAARRLTGLQHQRDMQAYAVRLNQEIGHRAVLTEADLILDTALAAHFDPEGGTP